MNSNTNYIFQDKSVEISGGKLFWFLKRIFDYVFCLILLPLFCFVFCVIFVLNRIFDSGSTLYFQNRMGLNGSSFKAIKFRSMSEIKSIQRKYDDPLELDRITYMGNILRKTKIDELPQLINILKGEMSLIGPRPDYFDHAIEYSNKIENYKLRYKIRPGITGLAQIKLGYAVGLEDTRKKTDIDLHYIENAGLIIDMKIIVSTFILLLKQSGS